MREYKFILLVITFLIFFLTGCGYDKDKHLITKEQCEVNTGYNVKKDSVSYVAIYHLDDGCAPLGCSEPYCVCSPDIILSDVDIDSFVIYGFGYAKDKNNVYRNGEVIDYMDAKTFEYLDVTYSKDANNVYRNGKKFIAADPETFEIMSSEGYSKDKNFVYYHGEILEGVDPKTFKP